jgi:cell wall-associated NlpC family hydrolase
VEILEIQRAARAAARAAADASAEASAAAEKAAAQAAARAAASKATAKVAVPPAAPVKKKATTGAPVKKKPAAPVPARKRAVTGPAAAPAAGAAGVVVGYARAQVGKRYVWATSGPNTFDCSGLVVAAYRKVGVSLPHQTGGLAGRGRSVSRAQLQPGDLVFPSSGHVGIYVGGGLMVHASTPKGGVKLSSIYRFSFARRIL